MNEARTRTMKVLGTIRVALEGHLLKDVRNLHRAPSTHVSLTHRFLESDKQPPLCYHGNFRQCRGSAGRRFVLECASFPIWILKHISRFVKVGECGVECPCLLVPDHSGKHHVRLDFGDRWKL